MPDKKTVFINIATEPQPSWEDLIRLLDEFKTGDGVNVEITGKDFLSYPRLPDLVKEIINRGMSPTAKVIITADNYKNLSDIVLFLNDKCVSAILFSQVTFPVISSENYSLLTPTKDMLPYLLNAIQVSRTEGLAYYLENLPLCILPGEENNFILGGSPGIKMQFCLDCELNHRCGGITKAQLVAQYGTQLLSWQFLFPKDFFTEQDIAFLDKELLRSADKT